jgi:hypothetical protein
VLEDSREIDCVRAEISALLLRQCWDLFPRVFAQQGCAQRAAKAASRKSIAGTIRNNLLSLNLGDLQLGVFI